MAEVAAAAAAAAAAAVPVPGGVAAFPAENTDVEAKSSTPAPGTVTKKATATQPPKIPAKKPVSAWKGWGVPTAAAPPAGSALTNIMSEELVSKLSREEEEEEEEDLAVAATAAADVQEEGESPPAAAADAEVAAAIPQQLSDHELNLRIQQCFDNGEDPSPWFALLDSRMHSVSASTSAAAGSGGGGGGGGSNGSEPVGTDAATATAAPPSTSTSSEALARELLEQDRAARQAAEDADLAVAMQLQEELDEARRKPSQKSEFVSEAQRLKFSSFKQPLGGRGSNGAGDDQLDDADASDEEWTAAVYADTTKHDADVCGIRNTKRLERDFDELAGLVEGRIKLSGRVANSLKQHFKKGVRKGVVQHGKVAQEERASVHGVLDKRTELVLFSWVSTGQLEKMSGALRTGKEASVFHALARPELARQVEEQNSHSHRGLDEVVPIEATGETTPAAIKVFKTTLSDFRNRSDYVVGDHRFAHLNHRDGKTKTKAYGLRNTRSLVMTWCEKEFKNLHRLFQAGVSCPEPFFFKENVLCMQFLGKHGRPAPQLHEVPLASSKRFRRFYLALVVALWKMYHLCDLVHGDLSPYNILYANSTLYIIDVGQAVTTDHPRARFFLERDCTEITRYFARAVRSGGKCAGLPLLSPLQLARFVMETDLGVKRNSRHQATVASAQDDADGGGTATDLERRLEKLLIAELETREQQTADTLELDVEGEGDHDNEAAHSVAVAAAANDEGNAPVGGWKMEMALRLATTHNVTKTQAREDNSSRQFSSVSR